uniref:Uncharacterized protein LOC111113930 n=1 Tax=Crassostrea virginica TaxID=6565 RepID=A0A8B8BXA3_CRAVI|nr:uncharacterized protein LOC111113930 [Crassostrea virginica]
MPKRRKSGRELRQRDRERKREVRRKAKTDGPTDADVVNPTVLCGTVDEAVTASPSNVLGQVSMGFPLKEEKPLARVRASLREKMHPLAPRLPPPRGSRLFVREQDKAPSPDSPAWVCAPPRAPGPDPVHGSGPAGQAQLEGSREECTSRILKDGGFKTISKQYSETITNSILNEQNVQETIYDENDEITMYDENEMNDISENVYESNDDEDVPNTRHVESCNQNAPKRGNDQIESANEKRKQSMKRRYQEDSNYRDKKLKSAYDRYREDKEYQANVRLVSRERYHCDIVHQTRKKQSSIRKYAIDDEHREHVKKQSVDKYAENIDHRENVRSRSIQKYAENEEHMENVKKRSIQKYAEDEEHMENVKKRSIQKYAEDEEHMENVKKRSIQKYAQDPQHRKRVQLRSIHKYKSDEIHKMRVIKASVEKYRENNQFREEKLVAAAKKYKTSETLRSKVKADSKRRYESSADQKKEKVKKRRANQKHKMENEDEVVKVFREKAKLGIDYSCCCCDRLLFENQVQRCDRKMYAHNDHVAQIADLCIQEKYSHTCIESCAINCCKAKLWICYTCHRKILRGDIPAEAASNKMCLDDIPKELKELNSLEKHLVAMHIPFMKVMALPHGGQKNIHGPVVCVPSDLKKVSSLPAKHGEDMLLRVKLKRKLSYKGYVEYQFVNPKHIFQALKFLKENNEWYKDVTIDTDWKEEINDTQKLLEGEILSVDENLEETACDTCLQPVDIAQEVLDHHFDDIYDIAPGEGKNPIRILQEPGNEAKTFPYLFPSGRFSWNDNRDTRITLSRYFNNRLMNTDDRFAKDSSYIFFSQFMSDLNQVIEKTQISIRKSVTRLGADQKITSDMVQDPQILSNLMKNDEALRFMQPIRGTPAYWSSAQKDLFAMLRQLGIPTWFCSFSAAEHRWNDAVSSILKQQNDNRDPTSLDWSEKNEVLRSNPVTVARMFEHRFHVFQKEVILSPAEPIGKVTDFFQRVEFQQRGSPHMHCLYWVENAPKLDEHGENAVCDFIDKYISCAVPNESEDMELREIVLGVQQHSKKHSKSCRKKGTECRFNFPRPPSVSTFINAPHESENAEDIDVVEMKREQAAAKEILLQVWNSLQNEENETKTTEEIFLDIGLTQAQYEEAHRILTKKKSIVLQRNPSEVWTNQYNPCLLKCWDANLDIQFVLDPFSCIVYIISYISKSEREMGMVLKQTKIEAEEGNESARTTLKKIGSAYLNHREVGAQEAVYRVCNLKMKECSRKVVFVPVGENPTRLTKPLSQLKRKSKKDDEIGDGDDEEEIWMTNIVERYENRPNQPCFQNMCLAEFCSDFRVLAKSEVPQTPNKNVFELQNSKGFIQKRTRTKPAIIRYPRFNVEKMSEKFYRSNLQLFLPYWTELHLKPPGFDLYEEFYENGHVKVQGERTVKRVKNIVDANRARFAQNEEIIAQAQDIFENIGEPEDAWANLCPETELLRQKCSSERNEVLNEDGVEELPDMKDNNNSDVLFKEVQGQVKVI